jgi:hypothetical protein
MDGKGRAIDNIFIERLWRSVKYEDVYLHAYDDGLALYRGMQASTLSSTTTEGCIKGLITKSPSIVSAGSLSY